MPITVSATPAPRSIAPQDLELVQRAISGDRPAFEDLYRRYMKKIYNLVYRMVGSAQEAEEVTQEVFYQAYRALPSFQGRSQFYTWIFRIGTNIALQHVKKQARKRKEVPFEEVLDTQVQTPGFAGGSSPERVAESRAFYRALERAVNSLPPNQRVVMVLGPIQGHSYEQMASILGTKEEVIKGRLHRARENVREMLKQHR